MNSEKQVFQELLNNGKFDLAGTERHLSMADLVKFIIKYEEAGVVHFTGEIIELTEFGVSYLVRNRNRIFLKRDHSIREDIPGWFLRADLDGKAKYRIALKGVKHISH